MDKPFSTSLSLPLQKEVICKVNEIDFNCFTSGIALNIQNLDDDISEENLREEFAKFGPIVCCSVCAEKSTKKMRCGTVSFLSPADAANAIAYMNGCVILKNTLFVTLASIKAARRRPSPTPYIQRLNTLSLVRMSGYFYSMHVIPVFSLLACLFD